MSVLRCPTNFGTTSASRFKQIECFYKEQEEHFTLFGNRANNLVALLALEAPCYKLLARTTLGQLSHHLVGLPIVI